MEGQRERDERSPQDPTRKLLKVFGVKVTDYEAKTDELLERFAAARSDEERATVVREAAELTADLTHWLREVQSHVLERQEGVLRKLAPPQR
jgi:hypothetical protein